MQIQLKKSLIACLIASLASTILYADNFVQTLPKASKNKLVSLLTPFDEALKREMQKYPKDSAFFVDGRTGKIISVNRLPKTPSKLAPKQTQKVKTKAMNPTTKPNPKIPYEMQEERIELLQ
ncbi:hypothetical protein [Helicobacter sp.]|uniref:hypothetical protein n=1 Tax=Helicobacter sp. TaxID=218 RepID=UPI0025C1F6EA|nr:hypothetical protein [Helicobacter sp.]MCI5968434.1 hypothetical protein [Helicobacter sp.]MDY2585219.1 hypothetical protein [Helicobacter sp.]